jgi:hypothetical protein
MKVLLIEDDSLGSGRPIPDPNLACLLGRGASIFKLQIPVHRGQRSCDCGQFLKIV